MVEPQYLVILQAKITQRTIIAQNIFFQLLNTGLFFKVNISFNEPPIELDDLTKGEMLSRGFVQASCSLDKLS